MTDSDLLALAKYRARVAEADTDAGVHPFLFDTLSLVEAKQWVALTEQFLAERDALAAQLAEVQAERDIARGELDACEQHVKILKEARDEQIVGREVDRLLTQKLGEVVAACPHCQPAEIARSTPSDAWICTLCDSIFTEPTYWQRVQRPTP